MDSSAMQMAQHTLTMFAIILVSGVLVGKLADRLRLPDVVLYLVVGIIMGPPALQLVVLPVESSLNQLILTLGASFMLFHGGMGVSFGILKKVWVTVLLLATVSVVAMTLIVGVVVHAVFGISLLYALLLGAILASTDPATLVPVFQSVGVRKRLAQTIISESAFNDATGAILTFTLLGVITGSGVTWGESIQKFMIMAGGGVLVGALYGLLVGLLISDRSKNIFAEYAQVLVMPLVIAAYITAEHLGASGFMAVFVAGLTLGNLDEIGWTLKENHHDEVHSFIHIASLLLRMLIFVLLGTHVDLGMVVKYFVPSLLVVAAFMLVARPLAVLLGTLPDRRAKWRRNEILFMFWTRETGVIPAALVGMLAGSGIEHADVIASVTFLAILVTLILQASTTPWLARKLQLLKE